MSASKEAWESFLFVPPPHLARRLERCRFFQAGSHITSQPVKRRRHVVRCRGAATIAASLASWLGESSAILASAPGKLAMMVAPGPPPMPTGVSANGTPPPPSNEDTLLEILLPGFDTSTFIWRISLLQVTNYAAALLLGSTMGTPKLCSLYLLGASWGPAIASGAIWRLLFPMMLHANALHIFFNIFFQLRLGFGMEKQFGRRKFCLLYLFCGFLGNLLSVVADPFKLAVGASTSGFGLLGVWAAEVLLSWELLGESRGRVFWWFMFMILSCITMSTVSPNVDFVGHFGGALAGFLLAVIMADMREEHQPEWYGRAKTAAKGTTAFLVLGCLVKAITLGPEGPLPFCGSLFNPRVLPF